MTRPTNWRVTVKFAEDDPIAYYSFLADGIPQGYNQAWDFIKKVHDRKLMGILIERNTVKEKGNGGKS